MMPLSEVIERLRSAREEIDTSVARGIEDGEAGREMDADDFLRQLASEP
jgi:hypothetical protein